MEQLSIQQFPDGDATCVRVAGELDLAVAGRFSERLAALAGTHQRVRLDLRDLTFIDSSGIAALVHASRQAAADGCVLTVDPELQHQVRRVLEVTGLIEQLCP